MVRKVAFSLAETMLALGLLSIAVLALSALGVSALRSTSKGTTSQVAAQVLHRELARAVYGAPEDATFWAASATPTVAWKNGTVKVGAEDFQYAIYAELVMGGPPNRLARVSALVRWRDGARVGYGELTTRGSQLVNECPP